MLRYKDKKRCPWCKKKSMTKAGFRKIGVPPNVKRKQCWVCTRKRCHKYSLYPLPD